MGLVRNLAALLLFVGCGVFGAACAGAAASRVHTFALPYDSAESVYVVGSFNSWEVGITPLKKNDSGTWEADVLLPAGMYKYMFVIDGGKWVPDPNARRNVPDGFGRLNSLVLVE